jgi:hypothetical protein
MPNYGRNVSVASGVYTMMPCTVQCRVLANFIKRVGRIGANCSTHSIRVLGLDSCQAHFVYVHVYETCEWNQGILCHTNK